MPYYYLLLFLLILVCASIEIYGANTKTTKIIQFVSFCSVFLTAGLKYETGIDWRIYEGVFSSQWPIGKMLDVGWSVFFERDGFEPGYTLFTAIIQQLGGTIQSVFFFAALINIILLYKSLTFFSKYPILCLLGYFCFVFFILDMSGLRQSLALNIALYGMRYASNRKLFKYIFFIFLAASFHQTAYFLLLLYPLFRKQKFNYLILISVYGFSLIVLFLKISWLEKMSLFILPIIGIEGEFSEKMVNYVFSSNYDDQALNIVKVLFCLAIIVYTYIYRDTILKDASSRFSFLCLIIFGIINNLMFELSEINSRLSAYLVVFLVVVVSNIIYTSKIISNRFIYSVIITFYCFLYGAVYILEKPVTIAYYPYQNYLVYKIFDIKSTGEKRLNEFSNK